MGDPFPQGTAPPMPPQRAALGDRSLFPELDCAAYLAHAAISPHSQPLRSHVLAASADYARRGVGAFAAWHAQRQRLKGRLAGLLGVGAGDLGLVLNTTAGVAAIAMCFPWRAGDRVVLFEGEFPTNVTPWQRAAELFGLHLEWLPVADFAAPGGADLGPLQSKLKAGARLVAASAVQFQTGLRLPTTEMAALCHRYGAELFVDAIQAVGATPFDASAVDYAAGGGHKWLMGPEGAGWLYVHPARIAALRPNLAGWLSHEAAADFLFEGSGKLRYDKAIRRRADVFEAGAPNTIGYAGLEAAVALIEQIGVDRVWAHANAYFDRLEPALQALGYTSLRAPDAERRSTILSLIPPERVDFPALASRLGNSGVVATTPDGLLRFAPHWPNALDEVDGVVASVAAASR